MNVRASSITILAVLLAVLTLASSAGAECAWVMWIAPAKVRPFKWAAHQAYDTRAECDREAGDRQSIYNSEHPDTPITTRCFPDTVDPRGPKGK